MMKVRGRRKMKKAGCLAGILFSIVTMGFFVLLIWRSNLAYIWNTLPVASAASTEKVLSYQKEVDRELEKYHLKEFDTVILAIMYQESRGEGADPMQSSESAGLARNEIQDTAKSIEQGVYHFYQMYTLGTKKGVDIDTIIQSYNMGPGYIMYVAENGLKHSEDLAKAYSEKQVERNPELYTCDSSRNFRYPYCYGDYTYVTKVNSKVAIFAKEITKS